MARYEHKNSDVTNQIFDTIDAFREFCVDYGYFFNEASLYDMNSFAWRQFSKFSNQKNFRNMWQEDAERFEKELNRNFM